MLSVDVVEVATAYRHAHLMGEHYMVEVWSYEDHAGMSWSWACSCGDMGTWCLSSLQAFEEWEWHKQPSNQLGERGRDIDTIKGYSVAD